MCLAFPMRVVHIDGLVARCEARGVEREVGLWLLQHEPLAVGDAVVVHKGHAVEKISHERAAQAWAVYDEMLAQLDAPDGGPSSPPR